MPKDKDNAADNMVGPARYKVVCPGGPGDYCSTFKPGSAKNEKGKYVEWLRLDHGDVISSDYFTAQHIASLLDNKLAVPYDGDEPTSPVKADERTFA